MLKRISRLPGGLDHRFQFARFVTLIVYAVGLNWVNSRNWASLWTSGRHRKEWWRVRNNCDRALDAGQLPTLTLREWLFVVTLYGYRCAFCGASMGSNSTTMEHLTPISAGGGTTLLNVVPCCKSCNGARSQMDFIGESSTCGALAGAGTKQHQ